MSNHNQLIVLICALCCLGEYAIAAQDEPIQIHSDYMQFDINTGNSIYLGNVRFVQGKIDLSGDRVNVSSKDGKVIKVHVEGTPARYQDSNESGRVLAQSQQMDYEVTENRLTMQGSARLEQDERLVQSQQIIYDTAKKLILAGKSFGADDGKADRVNITLTPKKDRAP
jgi:lipopolysaccharide transport protein LptA